MVVGSSHHNNCDTMLLVKHHSVVIRGDDMVFGGILVIIAREGCNVGHNSPPLKFPCAITTLCYDPAATMVWV